MKIESGMKWLTLLLFTFPGLALIGKGQENWESFMQQFPDHLEISLRIQNEKGETLFQQQANKIIPAASIIKIPILIALMEKVENKEIDLDALYSLLATDKVGGAGELQHLPDGSGITFRYLAEEMIRISDNTATNILIRAIEMDYIQDWLKENGYEDTQLNRIMMDFKAIEEGRQNYTSPQEINDLLLNLWNGKWLKENSRAEIMHWLKGCADNSTIPSLLPAGTVVAHKTGTLDYVRGDAGIILGHKPLILSVFVENFESMEEAESAIGKVALKAFRDFGR
ncbi:serine hydrolase [Cyclobacterium sp.]|uniref:serine hydrolase n=1 Tax=Cyclobacterium sp. TaxID=1966343 RepID=UPI0019C78C4C|nr:serine hydrolase [Cyclobacterium sp.]MBD3627700.1 serine hydrolase [Cyclobacterium sp.]